ncbi:trypsin-like serine peptidase [Yinghuangia aomiensis]
MPDERPSAIAAEPNPTVADERIIGASNDLQSSAFLPRGVRAAATVGRIWSTADGRTQACATGFLVAPRLLLTNHHVFPDAATAGEAFVEFGADTGLDGMPLAGTRFSFAADVFFAADENLDYALVAVAPGPDGRAAGDVFGWNRLDASEGKLVVGDPVNIIGHPSGRLKEIAIRDNRLLLRLDEFLQYQTDTEPGNSGSPVFNDQWEVAALHHRRRTEQRRPGPHAQRRRRRLDGGAGRCRGLLGRERRRAHQRRGPPLGRPGVHRRRPRDPRRTGPGRGRSPVGSGSRPRHTPRKRAHGRPASHRRSRRRPRPRAPPRAAEAAPVLSGIPGRPAAFGPDRQLVFLHGRSQQGHRPEDLRREWTAGLNGRSDAPRSFPPSTRPTSFPFYGDLYRRAAHAGVNPGRFRPGRRRPAAAAAPASPSRARPLRAHARPGRRAGGHARGERSPRGRGLRARHGRPVTRKPWTGWPATRRRPPGGRRRVPRRRGVPGRRRVRDEVLACVRDTVLASRRHRPGGAQPWAPWSAWTSSRASAADRR